MRCISFTGRVKAACVELIEINNIGVEEKAVLYRVKFHSVLRPYCFKVYQINPKSNGS